LRSLLSAFLTRQQAAAFDFWTQSRVFVDLIRFECDIQSQYTADLFEFQNRIAVSQKEKQCTDESTMMNCFQ
jgi:pyoverdine/dityrosine biosynthesis protein Dit1